MRAVILANGHLSDAAADRARLRPDDWILAADGGFHHAHTLGLSPSVVIGDLDSLSPGDLASIERMGAELVRHPARKDETDLELALSYARRGGADEILVLGALGNRWDQTLANSLLLPRIDLPSGRIVLADGAQEVVLARGGESLTLSGRAGDTVSLIPIGGDAGGVSTQGLEYPLHGETLHFAATRGVSNTLLGPSASLRLRKGLLLVILLRQRPAQAKESPT